MAAAKLAEIKQYVEAPNVSARIGEENMNSLQVSVTGLFNGLIGELRHLADDPAARLEKTPDQYERDFATQIENLRQRTLARVQSNLRSRASSRTSSWRSTSRSPSMTSRRSATQLPAGWTRRG